MTFIGPKPEIDVPEYTAPFRADDVSVRDANGRQVAYADTPDADHDPQMAQAIADALNEKFGGGQREPEGNAEVFDIRPGDPETARAVWVIVDGLAYFENYDGRDYEESSYSTAELRDPEGFSYLGRKRIDPSALVGVEGRE